MEYLRPDEIRRFLAASPPEFYALFPTAVLTGARQGELLGLKRGDVDPERGLIFIRRTFHPSYGFVEPKSDYSRRAIKMSPELVEILRAHLECISGDADSLVFPNNAGHPHSHQNLVTRTFHPTLERAGLRKIRFHDLRHTYAAPMISLDANPKVLQRQMGHSSIRVTMDTYGHLIPDVCDNRAWAGLDGLIFRDNIIPLSRDDGEDSGDDLGISG
jgi:integrase